MGSPLSSWPWAGLGSYKYLLYGPLVAKVAHAWRESGSLPLNSWCLHLLVLLALRSLTFQLWFSYGNMLFFTRRRRVVKDGVDFRQIDAEWDWDNLMIMQTLIAAMVINNPLFPGVAELRAWDPRGWAVALLLHVSISEPAFYWAHRALHRGPLFSHRFRHAIGEPDPDAGDGGPARRGVPCRRRVREPRLRAHPPLRLRPVHGVQQRGGHLAQALRRLPAAQIPHLHPDVFKPAPQGEGLQFLLVHASVRCSGRDHPLQILGASEGGRPRQERPCARLRVPGARGGRDVVDARAVRVPVVQLAALLHAPRAAPALAPRLRLHDPPVVLLQDLHRQLLLPPRPAPPDMDGSQVRVPVLHSVGEEGHQPSDRARHPEGGQDGRQSAQPCRAQQERGAQWRRHTVRQQAPEPEGEGGARQHAHGGRDPQRDPEQREGGVHHRRHVQARQSHRSLPLQEEDQSIDVDGVDRAVSEDPEGGAGRVPAVPGPGDQVPGRTELQDVDRGQVAVPEGAAVGAGGHALPPVRGAAHHQLPPGLHLRQARRHEAAQGRRGPRLLRVHDGAGRGARLPRRRRGALPGRVGPPRGGRHRRGPDRRRVEGGAEARPHAGVSGPAGRCPE